MKIKEAYIDKEFTMIKEFLNQFDLKFDDDIDYTLYIEKDDEIIGTISAAGYIIKSFAVLPEYQGYNIGRLLIIKLINYFHDQGIYYHQVYTKPKYIDFFLSVDFKHIASSKHVSLLESGVTTIDNELNKIKKSLKIDSDDIASIVVNANPTTNGHLYLITEVSQRHEYVIVFLVEEDKSVFSFNDRLTILKNATFNINNVIILPSTKYIISSLTFPTYFLKEDTDSVIEQAEIDALIFKNYFFPRLGLSKRYVGTETDLVTNKYNQKLKEILKDDLIVIDRVKFNEDVISASLVRSFLKEGKVEKVKNYVPKATYDFLKSEAGNNVIRKLQSND